MLDTCWVELALTHLECDYTSPKYTTYDTCTRVLLYALRNAITANFLFLVYLKFKAAQYIRTSLNHLFP